MKYKKLRRGWGKVTGLEKIELTSSSAFPVVSLRGG
jgi:hypothetical protein